LNNGDLSPTCNLNNPNQLSCDNGDRLSIQAYYYKSNPIVFKGVPPFNGWAFVFQPPCCRPGLDNLYRSTSKQNNIRAMMYPTKNNDDAYPCLYSSPEFVEPAANLICRGKSYTYNHSAQTKEEVDSIAYTWGQTYNYYPSQPAQYEINYNYDNPTPDQSFDSSNVPATINSKTGILNLSVY